jgi:hypothetical protein
VQSQKQYLAGQVIANLIGVALIAPIMMSLIFVNFGTGQGDVAAVQVSLLVFLSCFLVIQCHTAVSNTRREFVHGKWGKDGEIDVTAGELVSGPFARIWPAFPLGAALGAITAAAVPTLVSEPIGIWTVAAIAFVPLVAVSTVLILLWLPKEQAALVGGGGRGPGATATPSYPAYLFREHVLPWLPIQVILNFGIGYKQFTFEAAKEGVHGLVPVEIAAADAGIVVGILLFFLWLGSNFQVRPDVHFGRVPVPTREELSRSRLAGMSPLVAVIVTLVAFALVAGLVWGAYLGACRLAGIEALSPMTAIIGKTVLAATAAAAGNAVGVWWGIRREAAALWACSRDFGPRRRLDGQGREGEESGDFAGERNRSAHT